MEPGLPDGLSRRDLWYQLGPLLPDEFGRQQAARWYRVEAIQHAFRTGRRAAEREDQKRVTREKHVAEATERLKGRMGG